MGVSGTYFDGKTSRPIDAVLFIDAHELRVEHGGTSTAYEPGKARSNPWPSGELTTIEFPDGARFEIRGADIPSDLLGLDRAPQLAWERNWRWCVLGLLSLAAGAAFFYWQLFPPLVRALAFRMPESIVSNVSRQSDQLVSRWDDEPTPELASKLAEAIAPVRSLHPELALDFKICCGKMRISNAFALPSGTILVTRDLVNALSAPELTAVVLHEVGHVYYRHPMQMLIENRFLSATVMLVAGYGDAYGWGAQLVALSYSRDHEREADLFAGESLKKLNLSPALLSNALTKIEAVPGAGTPNLGWLSSHPVTADRKAYLQNLK